MMKATTNCYDVSGENLKADASRIRTDQVYRPGSSKAAIGGIVKESYVVSNKGLYCH